MDNDGFRDCSGIVKKKVPKLPILEPQLTTRLQHVQAQRPIERQDATVKEGLHESVTVCKPDCGGRSMPAQERVMGCLLASDEDTAAQHLTPPTSILFPLGWDHFPFSTHPPEAFAISVIQPTLIPSSPCIPFSRHPPRA
eukprot:1147766-Pelagomonas_calceolata.AAC.5